MDELQIERLVKPLYTEDKTKLLQVPGLQGIYGRVNPLLVEEVMGDTRFLKCACSAEVTVFEVDTLDPLKRAIVECVKCK